MLLAAVDFDNLHQVLRVLYTVPLSISSFPLPSGWKYRI